MVTVGQELRRLRMRRGISQFDLAVCMEWKGTNPIIQIEKDRRIPRPDTIERLGHCLGLSYLEIHYLNGLAGYVLPTRMPPRDLLIETLEQIADLITDFPYPAYVFDYQYRFWLFNPFVAVFLGEAMPLLQARSFDVFDMVFDSRLGLRPHIADLQNTEQEIVFTFKATNGFRQHEAFFQSLPERKMDTLIPEDYAAFKAVWQALDMNTIASLNSLQVVNFYARQERGDLQLALPEGTVSCHLRVEPVFHLGDLFRLGTFLPVDSADQPGNKARAEAIFGQYRSAAGQSIKVWEHIDLDQFYD
jgi:transcriptional regulator with XRE-family HTH domain